MSSNIRQAGFSPSDGAFILSAFDTSIAHLAASGNTGQWGTQPFSEKEGFSQSVHDDIATSKRYTETKEGEALRIFIYEIKSNGEGVGLKRVDGEVEWLSVAAVSIRDDDFAAHLKKLPELQQILQAETKKGFIFIDVLISDHRIGSRRKGSGLALLNHVKDLAAKEGKPTIFMDCYRGGSGRLIQYYEEQGFKTACDFDYPRSDGGVWQGRLLRLDLDGVS